MLRWFDHVERRMTKEIYEADLDGKVVRRSSPYNLGSSLGEHFLPKLSKF
jgi:hypothetical protein